MSRKMIAVGVLVALGIATATLLFSRRLGRHYSA
jgi:hypothetical protein